MIGWAILHPLTIFGYFGQAMFTMRFVVQWIASERAKNSIIPKAFWLFSLAGGIMLLIYAILKKDPVFVLGQSAGLLIYTRNIYMIYRKKPHQDPHAEVA